MSLLTTMMIFSVLCSRPGAPHETGLWTFYNQNPTDGTINYHQDVSGKLPQDMSPYDGVIAIAADCSMVGKEAWIRLTDLHIPIEYWNVWQHVVVFDCGGHQESIDNFFEPLGIIGELGFYLARDSGAMALGRAVEGDITWEDPTMECATPTPQSSPTQVATSTPLPTPMTTATTVYLVAAPLPAPIPTKWPKYTVGKKNGWGGVRSVKLSEKGIVLGALSLALFPITALYTWWWLAYLLWRLKVWAISMSVACTWRRTKHSRRLD